MPAIYHSAQKQRYRITLEITAMDDFDPRQIDWQRLFELEGGEHCEAYVESLNEDLHTW